MGKQKKGVVTNISNKELIGENPKNIEIETRLCLDNPDVLIKWLKESAGLLKVSDQSDYYFDPPHKSFILIDPQGLKDADEWLRIRLGSDGDSVCYKKWHREEKTGISLYAEEIEIPVTDGEQLLGIFEKMSFRRTSVIKKHRESWQYDDFIFDCDDVEELGHFVEIEYKGRIEDPRKERERIFDLLKKIGIKGWKIIDRGYPWMQWNKK